ncbi:hypothetical protein AeRB84_009282, partial [Aphanomyces euteiches]
MWVRACLWFGRVAFAVVSVIWVCACLLFGRVAVGVISAMWVRACLWFGRVAVAFVSALVEEVQCVQDIKAFKTWFLKLGLQMATILCTSLVAERG